MAVLQKGYWLTGRNSLCQFLAVSSSGPLRQMFFAQVALDAATPRADKRIVQCPANGGAGKGYHAAHPLFRAFLPDAHGQTSRDAGSEALRNLLFRKVFAQINSRRAGRCKPHLYAAFGFALFESIEKAESLDQAPGNDGKQAGVRKNGDHAAQAEPGALRERDTLRVVNQALRDGVHLLDRNIRPGSKVGT